MHSFMEPPLCASSACIPLPDPSQPCLRCVFYDRKPQAAIQTGGQYHSIQMQRTFTFVETRASSPHACSGCGWRHVKHNETLLQAAVVLSEAMDIPTLAENGASTGGMSRQPGTGRGVGGAGDMLEPQGQGSRPVWAGPSWPVASSQTGSRLSGSSPYGKSMDMADAMQPFTDTGEACCLVFSCSLAVGKPSICRPLIQSHCRFKMLKSSCSSMPLKACEGAEMHAVSSRRLFSSTASVSHVSLLVAGFAELLRSTFSTSQLFMVCRQVLPCTCSECLSEEVYSGALVAFTRVEPLSEFGDVQVGTASIWAA